MFIVLGFINLLAFVGDALLLPEPAKFVIDPLVEDDHEEFELSNIIASSEAAVAQDIDKYSEEDRKYILDLHNLYRSNQTYPIPKASDMNFLEYNKTLEWAAGEWLKVCKFAHGRGEKDNMSTVTNQNLYAGPSHLISRYMYLFYIEYLDFSFDTFKCRETPKGQPEVRCGHFETMMWGRLKLVGCAKRSYCNPRGFKSDILVACHFYHLAHWLAKHEMYIYTYGKPCTKCNREDGNLCHKNLCVTKRLIQKYRLGHTCELNCQNCGVPDWKKCTCKCKKGWDYPDCGVPCRDLYLDDPRNRNGPRQCPYDVKDIKAVRCIAEDDYYVWHKCRQSCGYCELISKKDKPKDLCCGGKLCKRRSVLDVKTCKCKRHCPTFGCLYSGSDSPTSPLLLALLSFIFISFAS